MFTAMTAPEDNPDTVMLAASTFSAGSETTAWAARFVRQSALAIRPDLKVAMLLVSLSWTWVLARTPADRSGPRPVCAPHLGEPMCWPDTQARRAMWSASIACRAAESNQGLHDGGQAH